VRHFRDAAALSEELSTYEELYVPQTALGELYYGAFKSAGPKKTSPKLNGFSWRPMF
jgi:predicted nucleic acid-binding protein